MLRDQRRLRGVEEHSPNVRKKPGDLSTPRLETTVVPNRPSDCLTSAVSFLCNLQRQHAAHYWLSDARHGRISIDIFR